MCVDVCGSVYTGVTGPCDRVAQVPSPRKGDPNAVSDTAALVPLADMADLAPAGSGNIRGFWSGRCDFVRPTIWADSTRARASSHHVQLVEHRSAHFAAAPCCPRLL